MRMTGIELAGGEHAVCPDKRVVVRVRSEGIMRWILAGILAATMAAAVNAQTERTVAGEWTGVRVGGAATVSVPVDWVLREDKGRFNASPRTHTRQRPSGETEFDLGVIAMVVPKQG